MGTSRTAIIRSWAAHSWRSAVAALVCALFLGPSCGPEHGFSGAWQQNCDDPAGGCEGEDFVYKLHIGRYGDDVTGLVVRYANDGAPFDPPSECGCFAIQGGETSADGLNFVIRMRADARGGGGPGCPAPEHGYASEKCRADLLAPPFEALTFELIGDEESLSGRLLFDDTADDKPTREFVPARGKTRRNCLQPAACPNLPTAGEPSP